MDYYDRKIRAQNELGNSIRSMQHGEKATYNDFLLPLMEKHGFNDKFLDKTLKIFEQNGIIIILNDGTIERA